MFLSLFQLLVMDILLLLQSRYPSQPAAVVPFQKPQEAPPQPLGASRLLLLLIIAVKAIVLITSSNNGGRVLTLASASAASTKAPTSTTCRRSTSRRGFQLSLGRLSCCHAQLVALGLDMPCDLLFGSLVQLHSVRWASDA